MLERFNRYNKQRKDKEHRSRLEDQVENALREQGFQPEYESEKFAYVLHRKYTPDFRVGDVRIEVKGWWPPAERAKFLAVVMANPTLKIFVALQRPGLTLNKNSKTTYAQWCQKHGIAWCPIPIPPDFLEQWLTGSRLTFHAQGTTATAQMAQASVKTEASTALSAKEGSTRMATHGNDL